MVPAMRAVGGEGEDEMADDIALVVVAIGRER